MFVNPWITSGFLTLQNFIDNIIFIKESGEAGVEITPEVTSF